MIKKIKQDLLSLLIACQGHKLCRPFFSGIGHILMFHRVCPKTTSPRIPFNALLEVTPDYLENVICFFKDKGYIFISLDQMYQLFKKNSFDKKFVAVTFDDGYQDNFIYAFPILKKHRVHFTIYVCTNFPDGKAVLWWNMLEDLILERNTIEIQLGNKSHKFNCTTLEEKENAFTTIRSLIIGFDEENFLTGVKEIFKRSVDDIYSKSVELSLNWEQIKELSQEPLVTIGAHTVNHYALKVLSEDRARHEVIESRDRIKAYIGSEVEHFAYPYGDYKHIGLKDLSILEKCGFKTAVTTIAGNIFPGHKDHLLYLPRINLTENIDKRQLDLHISGFRQFRLHKFKRVLTI